MNMIVPWRQQDQELGEKFLLKLLRALQPLSRILLPRTSMQMKTLGTEFVESMV
jgi:hypothetical protein